MAKITILHEIARATDGTVFVEVLKQQRNGDIITFDEPHRFSLMPGGSLDDLMPLVNGHLAQLGFPPVADADVAAVKARVAIEHTPGIVQAFAAKMATLSAQIAPQPTSARDNVPVSTQPAVPPT